MPAAITAIGGTPQERLVQRRTRQRQATENARVRSCLAEFGGLVLVEPLFRIPGRRGAACST
jgi:hypothetical protein